MTELSDSAEPGRHTDARGHDEELVRALLNATGQGIYGVDLEGNCTFANPACVAILGYGSDQELLGKNMHTLIHHTRRSGEPYPVEECRIYQAFTEGEGTHVGDEIVWRADGTSFPAEYWSYPLFLHSELAGSVVAFVDITVRKTRRESSEPPSRPLPRTVYPSLGPHTPRSNRGAPGPGGCQRGGLPVLRGAAAPLFT